MSKEKANSVPTTLPQKSESEVVQAGERENKRGRCVNSPKYSKKVWEEVKIRFKENAYTSLAELAAEYGIQYSTLTSRMVREKWNDQQRALQSKVESKIEQKALTEVERQSNYLLRLSKRTEKYEQIISASMDQLGSKDANGVPLLDPEAIDQFTRSEARLVDMNRVAYRLPTLSSQDITTGGADLGSSFVMAISKLREAKDTPRLAGEDLSKVLEAEIE